MVDADCGHRICLFCSIVGADWVEERHPAEGIGRSEGEPPHCGHCICFVVPWCSIVGADWVEERHPAYGGGCSVGENLILDTVFVLLFHVVPS